MFLKRLISRRKQIICALPIFIWNPFSVKTEMPSKAQDENLKQLWRDDDLQKDWYANGNSYWKECESSYDGVMGGYGHLSDLDIRFSRLFIEILRQRLSSNTFSFESALDCGAGIGRVSKELLSHLFNKVDLVEQCDKYIEEAKNSLKSNDKIRYYYTAGLQDFSFENNYDCIWIQWVSNQIKDEDYVSFLTKCADHLNNSGIIIVKENISEGEFILDSNDYSITRIDDMYKQLFKMANLQLVLEMKQPEFPQELFDVKMYALKKYIHLDSSS